MAEQFERRWFAKFEAVLDGATIGPTWLRDKRIASVLEESLHFRHDSVYRLDAFSIMPNHVHLLMKPLPINDESNYHSLSSIMQSLKVTLRSSVIESWDGTVSFGNMIDHYIRDSEEYQRTVAYIINNPVKAGFVMNWREWKWSYRRERPT